MRSLGGTAEDVHGPTCSRWRGLILLTAFPEYQKSNLLWWKRSSFKFSLRWDATCNRKARKGLTEVIWRKTGLNIFWSVCQEPYNTERLPCRKGPLLSLSVRKGKPLQPALDLNHIYHRFLVFPALTPQLNWKMQAPQKAVCAHRHFSPPQNSPSYISDALTSLFDSESLFLLFYQFSTASLSRVHRWKNPQLTPVHCIVVYFFP